MKRVTLERVKLLGLWLCLIVFGILIAYQCQAQTKKLFKTAAWGGARWGYYYHPAVTGKYPAVIYFHGAGEVGTDSVSVQSLLNIGPLGFIKTGWRPDLVVFAIQVNYWSPSPDLCKYILENDPDVSPYWDGKTILWTGVSAGGQRVLEAMALKYPGSFVPMSPAGIDFSRIDFSVPWRVWDFHASNDNVCPYKYSVDLIDLLNKTYPGSGRLTTYQGGHSGWNTYYNPAYKDPLSIYEWGASGSTAPGKTILVTITVYSDGTTEIKNNN